MAGNTKALRGRIKSVTSTLQLTKAMELVASSKIKRATEKMMGVRQYSASLDRALSGLVCDSECRKSPYMKDRGSDRTRILIIAGDRGLAGGYNANVFRLAREYPNAEFIPVGKRACERFSSDVLSSERFSFDDAYVIAKELCLDFCEERFDRFGIISTEYKNVMTQEARIEWILPFKAGEEKAGGSAIYEPDELTVLNSFAVEYVAGKITAAVRESFSSEVAARRMAMDSAGKNARQMIDDLSLEYNRARQGAITQEITEIVAGSGQ